MKKLVTIKWHDLGIELLSEEDVQALDEIQNNYPRDASKCCTKMFQLWLERQPGASWRQLIQALREPNIEMNELADTIEQKLISINKGNYESNYGIRDTMKPAGYPVEIQISFLTLLCSPVAEIETLHVITI